MLHRSLFIAISLGILVVVCLLTLALLRWYRSSADIRSFTDEAPPNPYTLVLTEVNGIGGCFAILFIVMRIVVPITTYYDYFWSELAFWPLLSIWFTSLGTTMILHPRTALAFERWWERLLLRFGGLLLVVLMFLFDRNLPTMLIQHTRAILDGPQSIHGIVMMLDSSRLRTPTYWAVINDTKYIVPNWSWWDTLTAGSVISFVQDPASTAAFPETAVDLSLWGGSTVYIAMVLWAWTLGFIIYQCWPIQRRII